MLSPFIKNSSQNTNIFFSNEEFCDQDSSYDFEQMLTDCNQDMINEYTFNDVIIEPESKSLVLNQIQFDNSVSNDSENTTGNNHLLKINQLFLSTQEVDDINLKDIITEKFTFAQTLLIPDDNFASEIDIDTADTTVTSVYNGDNQLGTSINQDYIFTQNPNNFKSNYLGILINPFKIEYVENDSIHDEHKPNESFLTLNIDDPLGGKDNQITLLLNRDSLNLSLEDQNLLNQEFFDFNASNLNQLDINQKNNAIINYLDDSSSNLAISNSKYVPKTHNIVTPFSVNPLATEMLLSDAKIFGSLIPQVTAKENNMPIIKPNFSIEAEYSRPVKIRQTSEMFDKTELNPVTLGNDLSNYIKGDTISIQDPSQPQFQLFEQVDDITMSSISKAIYNTIKHDGKLEILNVRIDTASNIISPNKIDNAYSFDKITKTIRFLLNPQDLGEIEIKFDTNNVLKFNNIRISVENNLTYEILNSIYHEIEQVLKDNGFDDKNSSLSMNMQSHNHNSQFEENASSKQSFNTTFAPIIIPQVLEIATNHEINIMV